MKGTLPVVLLISILVLFIPQATGDWNEVERLTYSGSADQQTVMVDNLDNSHILFQENVGGRVVLRYMKLDEQGETAISSRTVISGMGDAIYPAAALDEQGIHLVWWDSRSGNFGLYYTLLNFNGSREMTERSLGVELAEDTSPTEAAKVDLDSFGNLYMVWSHRGKNTDAIAEEEQLTPAVYFMKVDSDGNVQVPSVRISSGYANGIYPDIELDASARAHIVWSEDITGNYEVYHTIFQDQGPMGNPETNITRITDTPMESIMSNLLFLDDKLFVSWSDGDSNGDIFSLHLGLITASGLKMDIVVSDKGNAFYPVMESFGSRIYISWQDDRHSLTGSEGREVYNEMRDNLTAIYSHIRRHVYGEQGFDASEDLTNWEIYLGAIDIQGTTMENQTRITSMQRASVTPKISINSQGVLRLVWVDSSKSSGDLYQADNSETELEGSMGVIDSNENKLIVAGGIGLLFLIYALSGEGRRYTLYRFLVVPLYSTISKDRLMENENRRQIVALINSREGITFTDLMEALGLKNGALAYHLYTLERRRYIKSVKDGKYRRFYPRGARVTGLSSLEEKIIIVIRSNPSISQREIANIIESTPQTVNYNIKKLIQRGVIYLKKEGKHTRCNLTNPNL